MPRSTGSARGAGRGEFERDSFRLAPWPKFCRCGNPSLFSSENKETSATLGRNKIPRAGLGSTLIWSVTRSKTVKSPRIISDPEIVGGTPVFVGTRVPVRILFEHLEAGDSLEVFLEDFPSVSRELAIQVLEDAKTSLVVDAHPA